VSSFLKPGAAVLSACLEKMVSLQAFDHLSSDRQGLDRTTLPRPQFLVEPP
jgi:hypothetical protein